MPGITVGVVGATGLVGQMTLNQLAQRAFPVRSLRVFASFRSRGQTLDWKGQSLTVETIEDGSFGDCQLVFCCAGTEISRRVVPQAVAEGAVVIDKSNAFRLDDGVPLVVPEVNSHHLHEHQGIIANPNCTTIQLTVALAPLAQAVGLNRVVVSTYQSVSGSGRQALEELAHGSRQVLAGEKADAAVYPHPIAFNLLPHIDGFDEAGFTGEERKLMRETKKILGLSTLPLTATAVRVPVFTSHGISVMAETGEVTDLARVRQLMVRQEGLTVVDDVEALQYPMPSQAVDQDEVLVGRIRQDESYPRALHFWVVADNLRKGAATNAVQIAEALLPEWE